MNKDVLLLIYFVCTCILIIYSLFTKGFSLFRFFRLSIFFILYPIKFFIILILAFLHFELSTLVFKEIFQPKGTLDPVTKSVLNKWWVLLLIYFITGNKMMVGFVVMILSFVMGGYSLRKKLTKDNEKQIEAIKDINFGLFFTIIIITMFIIFMVQIMINRNAEEYNVMLNRGVMFIQTFLFTGLFILFVIDLNQKNENKKKTKQSIDLQTNINIKTTYMFPFELRKRKWYEWVVSVFVVLLAMLAIIPIGYVCAFIYMFNPDFQ